MRIAICDDEPHCLGQAVAVAEEYLKDRKEKKLSLHTFSTSYDLLEEAEKTGGFDIYVLDIVMPGMNGIQLGKKLRDAGYNGKIIYLTSSEEYSLDAFRVKALNYIIKPITKEAFYEALDEALDLIYIKNEKSFVVKTKERTVKLTFDSIMYIETSKRTVIYHLVGGKSVESLSMRSGFGEAIADLLDDKRFVLCGAGMAVNLDHVTEIENEAVAFGDTYKPFLGKKACRELRVAWSDYLLDSEG
ncbi:MAG: response regulator transcription factor [Clostridia bacterium]|nr:response regulator transcription factor [Clostridia bacterium]